MLLGDNVRSGARRYRSHAAFSAAFLTLKNSSSAARRSSATVAFSRSHVTAQVKKTDITTMKLKHPARRDIGGCGCSNARNSARRNERLIAYRDLMSVPIDQTQATASLSLH